MQKDDAARPNVSEAGVNEPATAPRELSAAAKRALAEAEERRRQAPKPAPKTPEIGGRDGPDPVRYGDWETKGIASDF
ncbi:MAG: DUF1674 domain-containing protein [Methylovirgula sp.]